MPEFKSTQITDTEASPRVLSSGSCLRPFFAKYVCVGTEASSDTIDLFVIPKGYALVSMAVWTDGIEGTSTAVDIGPKGGDVDAFVDGLVTTNAIWSQINDAGTYTPSSTADTTVTATLVTATASPTAGKFLAVAGVLVQVAAEDF